MKHILVKFGLLLTIITLVACSPQQAPTEVPTEAPSQSVTTFVITGSGSVTPILAAVADQFTADNPGYQLDVLPGSGTGGGVRGILDGTLDLAAMSRPPKDTEEGVEFVEFGTSVTAVMSHPDVGATSLTSDQLTDILSGEITNWSDVGGSDIDIVVYVRDPEEGNTVDVRESFVGDIEFAEAAQVLTSQTDMQEVLENVEGAIGYGTWATVMANGANIQSLTIDGLGVDNAPESMINQLGIGYISERKDDVKPLVDWLQSDTGKSALEAVAVSVAE